MKKNKYWIRTTAIVLASTVLTGNTLSVFAAADNTEKDENIYGQRLFTADRDSPKAVQRLCSSHTDSGLPLPHQPAGDL